MVVSSNGRIRKDKWRILVTNVAVVAALARVLPVVLYCYYGMQRFSVHSARHYWCAQSGSLPAS
jgi:hypothetical protein